VSKTTEELFGPFLVAEHATLAAQDWAKYLRERYSSFSNTASVHVQPSNPSALITVLD
jgi:hypothetical protein